MKKVKGNLTRKKGGFKVKARSIYFSVGPPPPVGLEEKNGEKREKGEGHGKGKREVREEKRGKREGKRGRRKGKRGKREEKKQNEKKHYQKFVKNTQEGPRS